MRNNSIKVTFSERRIGRDYFRIKEGVYKGKNASVSQKSEFSSWLGKLLPTYRGPVTLTFKKGEGKLITPIGALTAITYPEQPIPNGQHPIQLPAFPHDLGRSYVFRASKAMTWFYLVHLRANTDNIDPILLLGIILPQMNANQRKWVDIRLVPVDNSLIFINFMSLLRAKRTDPLTNRFFLLSIWPV